MTNWDGSQHPRGEIPQGAVRSPARGSQNRTTCKKPQAFETELVKKERRKQK